MTRPIVRVLGGLAGAVGLSLPFMTPSIAGIATWKIVLGCVGAATFMAGSRRERPPGAPTQGAH